VTPSEAEIRSILGAHGQLLMDATTVDALVDLFDIGMTSHATVNVMLALEEAFDVEFPDSMLVKGTFESVQAIGTALTELGAQAPVSY
jgi:acyl carrier protein